MIQSLCVYPGVTDHVPHPQGENLNFLKRETRTNVDEGAGGEAVIDGIDGIDADIFCKELRQLQQRTRCTENTVLEFISTFEKYIKCPVASSLRACDKKMQVVRNMLWLFYIFDCVCCCLQSKAGVSFLALNGCTKCNKFVYLPSDKRKNCPHVKTNGEVCGEPRYDTNGKAKEV